MTQEDEIPAVAGEALNAQFEQAIIQHHQQRYYLRLYIAGSAPRSLRALENLKAICEAYLQGRYELEVIDIYQTAPPDYIIAIPTLIKQSPLPIRYIVGDLSDAEKVLIGLDLVSR